MISRDSITAAVDCLVATGVGAFPDAALAACPAAPVCGAGNGFAVGADAGAGAAERDCGGAAGFAAAGIVAATAALVSAAVVAGAAAGFAAVVAGAAPFIAVEYDLP